jgi:hypothetical protein
MPAGKFRLLLHLVRHDIKEGIQSTYRDVNLAQSENWEAEFMDRVPGAEHYDDDHKWFLAALRLAGPVFG